MRRARERTVHGWSGWLLPVLLLATAASGRAAEGGADGGETPRILTVQPAREGDLLVCTLTTSGLPGEKLASSMESGLVSAVDVVLDLVNAEDEVVAENRLTLRLAFDLWEEVFSVQNHQRRRFARMEEVEAYLARLPRVPVASADLLDRGGPFRIRAGLRLHPVAPSERERAGDVIVGESLASGAGAGGGQEVTFSLGKLIRFFYRGGAQDVEARLEAVSRPFGRKEVGDAED